jgi:hypothetical protein
MAIVVDRENEIITLTATNDTFAQDATIQGILFYGTAAGSSEVQDNAGNTIAKVNLTTSVLSYYVPVNRLVTGGLLAKTIATNQTVYVYLKKG